jgi:hypothetical protein
VRYDYILASHEFPHELRHCRRIDSDTSDHYALYLDIRLKTSDEAPPSAPQERSCALSRTHPPVRWEEIERGSEYGSESSRALDTNTMSKQGMGAY